MKLAIIRHGQAQPVAESDAARSLTDQGQYETRQLAMWLAGCIQAQDFSPDRLIASPYVRAQQTAAILAEYTGLVIEADDKITPAGNAAQCSTHWLNQTGDMILVSHLPMVGRLTSLLTDGQISEQNWATAECRILEGNVIASGCMTVSSVWSFAH